MATIRKRGGTWQVQVRCNGATASKTFSLRADAVRWSREAELKAERGELQNQEATRAKPATLAEVLVRYRDTVTSIKRSASTEQCAINAFLRTRLARTRLDNLTPCQIAAHRDRKLQTCKPATVVRELGWLQHAIDIACTDWGQNLPNGNPVKAVRRPRIDNRRERRLQPGEWSRLLAAVDPNRSPLMRPLLTLALETGMRRGELLAMEWRHVDLERRVALLPRTKNGHARTVPLSPTAVQTLTALPRDNDRCVPLSGNGVRLAFARLRERAGISDLTFHDIRHEATSRFVERGLSLAEVQMITGHRDLRMLIRYTHLQVDDIVQRLHEVC